MGGFANIAVAPIHRSDAHFEPGPHFHLAWGWEWDIREFKFSVRDVPSWSVDPASGKQEEGQAVRTTFGWVTRFPTALEWEPPELPTLAEVRTRLRSRAIETAVLADLLAKTERQLAATEQLTARMREVEEQLRSAPTEALRSEAIGLALWAEYQGGDPEPEVEVAEGPRGGPLVRQEFLSEAIAQSDFRTLADRRQAPAAERLAAAMAEEQPLASGEKWPRPVPAVDRGWYLPNDVPDGLPSAEWVTRVRFDDQLRVTLYDLGHAIAFGTASGNAEPLSAEWRGMSLAEAFLDLDTSRGEYVASFFETFGEPPDLRGYFWTGTRWLSINRVRHLQDRVRQALIAEEPIGGAWWEEGRPDSEAEGLGVVALEAGIPTVRLNLWQALALSLANEQRDGRIGYCAAPKPWETGSCGRPFLAHRKGRRRYCSDLCASRATTRRARGRRGHGAPGGEAGA